MGLFRFFLTYVRSNFQVALEYRVSFWVQVLAMALNDTMWIVFWAVFFARFPVVHDYGLADVITVWSVAALAIGLATGLFGGAYRYAGEVARGRLDFYLVLPKPVLFHLAISSMSVSAWGDVLFGLAAYLAVVRPGPGTLALFLFLALASAAVFVAYSILANALAFWLGNAEGFARQLTEALITFSLYPSALFSGAVKLLLFTLIPAGFIAYIPVELLRAWSWPLALALLAAAAGGLALARLVFYAGLRRYESGNTLAMRES
ncbi:MAG TPA: ABC-2 family transporter protein [Chloroflexota bacterium]|jgi:ABC-2 type transport system permease protein|nr:ABC-2 family transporter protein [Chloroflexota bacterium]